MLRAIVWFVILSVSEESSVAKRALCGTPCLDSSLTLRMTFQSISLIISFLTTLMTKILFGFFKPYFVIASEARQSAL